MSHKFYGGVHPPAFKALTSDRPIKRAYIPKKVVLPLSQHVGSPAEPVVSAGDMVSVGKMIAKPGGHVSAALHATISGKVTKIGYHPTPTHPRVMSIIIESQDDADQEFKILSFPDVESLTSQELLTIIRDAGIVGLGGAAFPTHVKLSPPETKKIDTVIVNSAECEPYLTCDHRLMLEKPKEILKGLDIIIRILGARKAFIAVEDNKLSGIYAMERALGARKVKPGAPDIRIITLATKYPQGAEKQLIKSVTGRVVPAGALPMDVGCVVQNVGTVLAVYEAVYFRKPLIERVITITGPSVKEPINLSVRIGTLVSDLVTELNGFVKDPKKVVIGGPMMGIAQYTTEVPVLKGTSGILFLPEESLDRSKESVCIRCGRCLEVCPMALAPTALMYRVKKDNFAEARELGIMNCYECGACAYACPAKIPLLDYMKYGKAKLVKV